MSILGDDVPCGCFYTCRVTPRKVWCAERYTLTCEDGNKVTVFLWKDMPEWDGFTRQGVTWPIQK